MEVYTKKDEGVLWLANATTIIKFGLLRLLNIILTFAIVFVLRICLFSVGNIFLIVLQTSLEPVSCQNQRICVQNVLNREVQ